MEHRSDNVGAIKETREELTNEIKTLEADVDNLESAYFDEILSLHKEANQMEFEIDILESALDEVTEEIEEIKADLKRADELHDERTEIGDRSRINGRRSTRSKPKLSTPLTITESRSSIYWIMRASSDLD
ncbi:hypothetical protein [Halobellus rufus]|uniref:hypothetical protein n=1 Tax=Halobellus rufus TaxID=1448860 RepID=UPI000679915E|nr:hypothetical protein [Halobellus rufus]